MGFFGGLFGDGGGGGTDWDDLIETGLTLYGDYAKGQSASSALKATATNYKNNAKYEKQLAVDSNERGSEMADKSATSAERYKGKQMAAEGASGVVANSGSFQGVNEATRDQLNSDTQTIMRNTMREAYGHTLAAETGMSAASAYTTAASNAELSSNLSMAGDLLTSKWWE